MVSLQLVNLIVCLATLAEATWDVGAAEIHINPDQVTSGSQDGTKAKPYATIMQAFKNEISDSDGTNPATSFCLKLWQNTASFELTYSDDIGEDFKTLKPKSSTTKIHMFSWDSVQEKASTTNVVFYYKDVQIKWKLEHAWELSFSYVTIRSDTLVFDNPTSDLYRHCHFHLNMAGGNITGTGLDFNTLTDVDKKKLYLGAQVYQGETTKCTGLEITVAATNEGKAILDAQGNPTYITKNIENATKDSRLHYGFVDVATAGSALRMDNCLFTEFRYRPNYIINSSNGGNIYLTNVDFVNIEPSQYGHEDQETDIETLDVTAEGIITSFIGEWDQDDEPSAPCDKCFKCSYEPYVDPNATEDTYPEASARPCGEIVWNGGTVTGLNKDVNVVVSTGIYKGFMDLKHMNLVSISNVNFEYNVIPSIHDDVRDHGIITLKYCAKIVFQNCKFDYNMAMSGAIYILYYRELWEVDRSVSQNAANYQPMNLLSLHEEVITFDGCEFTGNTQFASSRKRGSALTLDSTYPINAEIKNCVFRGNNSAWSKHGVLIMEGGSSQRPGINDFAGLSEGADCAAVDGPAGKASTCYVNENYYAQDKNEFYWTKGFYLKITDNIFDGNYASNLMNLEKWANLQMSGNTITNNQDYDYDTACSTGTWATMKKYVDEGRIQSYTPSIASEPHMADCWIYGNQVTDKQQCEELIKLENYGIYVDGTTQQSISSNTCSNGLIMQIKDENGVTFRLENVLFDSNVTTGTESYLLEIKHTVTYNESTKLSAVIPEIKNCIFTSNNISKTSIGGLIYNEFESELVNDYPRLKVSDCTFRNNAAPKGPALYWQGGSLIIQNSIFEGNTSTTSSAYNGGTIYFMYGVETRNSNAIVGEFSCTNCTFLNNVGGYNPDICTEDYVASAESFMKFFIVNSTFTGSRASSTIGSIRIGRHGFAQSGDELESYIQDTTFTGISSTNGGGTIFSSHLIGALTMTNIQFESLTSGQLSCGVNGDWGTDETQTGTSSDHTYVKIVNSSVRNCDCGQFFYIVNDTWQMHVITNTLTVSDNLFSFAHIEYGFFTEANSVFTNIGATNTKSADGSVYYGTNRSVATFTNTVFTNCASEKKGGAVYLSVETTRATFTSISATNNEADKGGFVYVQDQASFEIVSSDISNNKATKGSAIFCISADVSESIVTSTTIIQNTGYGCIFLNEARLRISTSTVQSNKLEDINASDPSPGMVLIFSTVTSTSSTYSDHKGITGAFLLGSSQSSFSDTGSTFKNGDAATGGWGYIVATDVSLTNTVLDNFEAFQAGFIYGINESTISLNNVQVSNINTGISPALIYNLDSQLDINNSDFQNFNGTGIEVANSDAQLNIINTNFTYGGESSIKGGALHLSNAGQLTVTGSRFEHMTALDGGAFWFDNLDTFKYTIGGNTFTNWTSYGVGGAIYNQEKNMDLYDNYFYNNSALNQVDTDGAVVKYGDGGAIYTHCASKSTDCICDFKNNTFEGNYAAHDGGAIKWTGQEPYNITTNNTYGVNNTALYGNNYASTAVNLVAITMEDYENDNLDATSVTSRLLGSESLDQVASGQKKGNELIIVLRDKYGQAKRTDQSSQCTLVGDANISLGGETVIIATNGVYVFDDFSVTAFPGSNSSFKIQSDGIEAGDIGAVTSIDVDVSMRQCESGEIQQGTGAAMTCQQCAENTYAIEVNATVCTGCLETATCLGGNTMYPDSGYWRPSLTYDGFFTWLRPESCLGNENFTNQIGECAEGYVGNLCQSCDDNYSRISKNTCGLCPEPDINGVRIGGILIVMVLIICVMVRSTLASASKKKEAYSIYFKIFANYLQAIVLTASFKLNWPSQVQDMLNSQEEAGSVTEQLFSFDCYMMEMFPNTEVFFQKLVLILFLPILMIGAGVCFWLVIAIRERSTNVLKNQLVSTVIVLFFLAHPVIVKTMFSAFSCMDIDGTSYLYEDLDIECYDETHSFYSITCALPGMVIWGISAPMLAMGLLIRERRRLDELEVKVKYGFLYIGYRKGTFIWEFVILYRKIAIVFVSVFLAAVNVPMQALTAMFILMIAFYLQEHYEPYETEALNDLEKKSIICAAITIYCGLYFLTDSIDNTGKLAFFLIIVIVNLYFLITWGLGLFFSFAEKGARTQPIFFRKWCKCWPEIWRSADRVLRKQIDEGLNVIPMDEIFDPNAQFELEGVDDDIGFYKFIVRTRAQSGDHSKCVDVEAYATATDTSFHDIRHKRVDTSGTCMTNRTMNTNLFTPIPENTHPVTQEDCDSSDTPETPPLDENNSDRSN